MWWNGACHCEFDRKLMETETKKFPNGGKAIVEQRLASEEVNRKAQDCESHSQWSE